MAAMPDWTRYAIFWGVFPLGFTGAEDVRDDLDGPPVHRLRRLIGWLDHLVELGCNGLLLNPLFASMSHGYDTLDYFRIDPRVGDDEDFDALVAACHDRGIRVVLDGVFNHVGRGYPGLDEVLERGAQAPAAHLFKLHTDGDRVDVEVFEQTAFIRGVENGVVRFEYRGRHKALFENISILNTVQEAGR